MSEEHMPATMDEEYDKEGTKKQRWSQFVETTLADLFANCKLEKLSVEDGNGNKAKLSRTKDNGLKIEQSSTTII